MTIKVFTNIQELSGVGEEWLVKNSSDKEVLAKFYDGNLENKEVPCVPNTEPTAPGVDAEECSGPYSYEVNDYMNYVLSCESDMAELESYER